MASGTEMNPSTPRTRRRHDDVETELDLCYRDQVTGDGRIPWFSIRHTEWLEEHFDLTKGTILQLYQKDVGLVARASSLILDVVHNFNHRASSSSLTRLTEPFNAQGLPAWFTDRHNAYLRSKYTGKLPVLEIYQSDQELMSMAKQLLVRELSSIGRIVPEYDDQEERAARLRTIGNPPPYSPPNEYTVFGEQFSGDMWYQPPHILRAFYEMTEEQVARLPDGIREQVIHLKVGWAKQQPEQRLDARGRLVTRVPYRLTLDREYSQHLQTCTRDDIADMNLEFQATAIGVRRLYLSEEEITYDRLWWQARGYMLDDEFGGNGPWLAQREEIQARADRHPDDVFDEEPDLLPYVNTNVLDATGGPNYIMMQADQDVEMLSTALGGGQEQESDASSEMAATWDEEPEEELPASLRIGHRPRAGFSVPAERHAAAGRSRHSSGSTGPRTSPRSAQSSSSRRRRSPPETPQRPFRTGPTQRSSPPVWWGLSSQGQRPLSPTAHGNTDNSASLQSAPQRPRPRALPLTLPATPPNARAFSTYTPPPVARERATSRGISRRSPTRISRAPTTPPTTSRRSSRTPPVSGRHRDTRQSTATTPRAPSASRQHSQRTRAGSGLNLRAIRDVLRAVRPNGGSRVRRPMPSSLNRRQRSSDATAEEEDELARGSPSRRRSPRNRRSPRQ